MKRRILFLAMNLNSGGAERQMVTMAKFLINKQNDVSFVCYQKGSFFEEELQHAGVTISWLIEDRPLQRLLKYRHFIRNGNYDVVISFLETANILNLFAGLGGRKWKIITGERSSKKDNLTSLRGHIVAFLQRFTDRLVCNSKNALMMWREYYPFLEHKLSVVYNCVTVDTSNICDNYYKNKDIIKILIAASYRDVKNLHNLISAVGLLPLEQRNCLCIDWYGAYELPETTYYECKKLINHMGLDSSIHLHGPVHNIHDYMRRSDMVALFSKFEGLPNAICEAMMIGVPIMMTKVSDYNNLINGNGILCQDESPQGIKDALENAIALSSDEYAKMGRKSKEIAESLFSESRVMYNWEEIIEKL